MRHPFDPSKRMGRAAGPGLPKPVYLSDRFPPGSSDTGRQRRTLLGQPPAPGGIPSHGTKARTLIAWLFPLVALWGCASSRVNDPDIVRPAAGGPELQKLPGPMIGPFTSLPNALIAACNRIMSKPNAAAGRTDHQDSATRWRFSSEYCAWIYYTPEHKYVVSKLTDQSRVDPALRTKTCVLPSEVEDARYPPESIKYIYALHNHPLGGPLSDLDVRFILSQARQHGFETLTKDGIHQLSLVAFFSTKVVEPTCDGFLQYIPSKHEVLTWTRPLGRWKCERTGRVVFRDDSEDFSFKSIKEPCQERGAP